MAAGTQSSSALTGWRLLLIPPLIALAFLFVLPQASFIWMSLHRSGGFGMIGSDLTLYNYRLAFSDPLYLDTLYDTLFLAAIATIVTVLLAFPAAYLLVRLRWRHKGMLIDLLLVSALVTIAIKILGLSVLLSDSGVLNNLLLASGLISEPLKIMYTRTGVVIGLVQFTLPFLIMMYFSVVQTIPEALEEASEVHGAGKARTFFIIIVPLARQGILSGALIAFNLNAGAFASVLILGGGRVLTLPVLIYRTVSLDFDYPTGAALSTMLVGTVLLVNIIGGYFLLRKRKTQ